MRGRDCSGGQAQPCDCPRHFQNKPGRCSKGKRVNLMTTAISSSRNLLTLPSGKSCIRQKSGHLLRKRKTEPEIRITHVGPRFHHAFHTPAAAGGRWNVNRLHCSGGAAPQTCCPRGDPGTGARAAVRLVPQPPRLGSDTTRPLSMSQLCPALP